MWRKTVFNIIGDEKPREIHQSTAENDWMYARKSRHKPIYWVMAIDESDLKVMVQLERAWASGKPVVILYEKLD